jgi:hypothetical protein
MHYIIEQWTPTQAWLDLSAEERQAFVVSIMPIIERHTAMGIETIAMGTVDADTDAKSAHRYWSVIRAPDEAAAKVFEADVRGCGWYEYFDQFNARGEVQTVEAVIGELIGL